MAVDEPSSPAARSAAPALAAPIGVDASGAEMSLFALSGPGLALRGPGADAVARAVLASDLATGVHDSPAVRPVVVTTPNTLARLLPDGAALTGLDPHGVTFDGERLIVLADTGAVTHAEEDMIGRRRLLDTLDTLDADTITDLNTRDDHIEHQPPYVLLIDNTPRHGGRVAAVAAHCAALHLHPVVLGAVTLITDTGPVTTGMRTGSYAALALLAAHPHGRTLAQISADLRPDTDPGTAAKRIRTDINTVRRVLRAATGAAKAKFVLYDPVTGRYRIDPTASRSTCGGCSPRSVRPTPPPTTPPP